MLNSWKVENPHYSFVKWETHSIIPPFCMSLHNVSYLIHQLKCEKYTLLRCASISLAFSHRKMSVCKNIINDAVLLCVCFVMADINSKNKQEKELRMVELWFTFEHLITRDVSCSSTRFTCDRRRKAILYDWEEGWLGGGVWIFRAIIMKLIKFHYINFRK